MFSFKRISEVCVRVPGMVKFPSLYYVSALLVAVDDDPLPTTSIRVFSNTVGIFDNNLSCKKCIFQRIPHCPFLAWVNNALRIG